METIILEQKIAESLKDLCIRNNKEYVGMFVGLKDEKKDIKIIEGILKECNEEDADINKLPLDTLNKYLNLSISYENIVQIPVHIHSVKDGEKIRNGDPYFSMEDLASVKSFLKYNIKYHLFIHPKENTEGRIMRKEKVRISPLKYDKKFGECVKRIRLQIKKFN